MGSGICGLISVRDLLGLQDGDHRRGGRSGAGRCLVIRAGPLVNTNSAATFADGLACRVPVAEPVEIIRRGAARVVRVTEEEIADAIRAYYVDTHNLAEGAGAAPLAALIKERSSMLGKRVGLILSGGNIDRELFANVLAGQTPGPSTAESAADRPPLRPRAPVPDRR